MILQFLARRAKRRHNALYVEIVWMEPWGESTWCVFTDKELELARSRWLHVALFRAGVA